MKPRDKKPKTVFQRVVQVGSWVLIAVLLMVIVKRIYPSIGLAEELGGAPNFEFVDLDGNQFRLGDQRGKVVVLNFWATWCPPCLAEIPGFVRLQEEFQEDVVFVGLAMDEQGAEVVEPFLERLNVNYTNGLDRGRIARLYDGASVLPTTILIDQSGHIRYRHEGLLLAGALRSALNRLLEEG